MSTLPTPADNRRFAIAVSFPGERRAFVKLVADRLAAAFGEEAVLYDKYHEAEFARVDLDVYLPNLYRTQSELLVVFLCPEYAAKRWCNLEWRNIRQLIASLDAHRIMFVSFGDPGDVSPLGILSGDGYLDIGTRSAEEIADKILERLHFNAGGVLPRSAGVAPSPAAQVEISRIIKYAPADLIGRETETKQISDAWDQAVRGESMRPHILTFVALGGEGKTSLVAKWAADLAHQDWPGCDAAFAWSFYSQGTREQTAASSDLFLKEALTFFGDTAMAESAAGAFDKGRRLAQLVGERRALLILDGLEPLQYAPTSTTPGELKDQGVASLLKGLAATSRGLCIVTTRYSITDVRVYWQTTAPEEKLLRLSQSAGVALLKRLGVKGNQQEFETLVADVKGHALTLNLLGTFLRDAHAGDIRRRDLVNLKEADAEEQGGHAFRVMDAYAQSFEKGGKTEAENQKGRRALALLRLLGLFDRPASADCLAALWNAPVIPGLTALLLDLPDTQRTIAVTRLESARLIAVNRDAANRLLSLDAHPLIREYFAIRVREQQPDSWRAAHRRLYEHLRTTTKEGSQPTLEDLQPLYQAVAHGCQAGMQLEAYAKVYRERIQRGPAAYSSRKLGAFASDLAAVACFFESPWSRVSSALAEKDRAVLLGAAAFRLRALGHLTEALVPMRAALERDVTLEDWDEAATSASNLSELELTLGELAAALEDARQSVSYADRQGIAFSRKTRRARLADALHQSGKRAEAETYFREAENLQAKFLPHCPLLYSVSGFQYCDLLLAEAERGAWRALLGAARREQSAACVTSCGAVSERAARTLDWAVNRFRFGPLSIALDHVTLGRAALYEWAVSAQSRSGDSAQMSGVSLVAPCAEAQLRLTSAATQLGYAVDGLRRAGVQHHLPRGLLTRAWCSFAEATTRRLLNQQKQAVNCTTSAERDLDEAWDIAERGPMPLFLADIHLHRARLFHVVTPYPWGSPQVELMEARRLIEKHGYWRRKEELGDAEEAAKHW